MNIWTIIGIAFVAWVLAVGVVTAIRPRRMQKQFFPLILAFVLWPAMLLRRALTGRCPLLDSAMTVNITQYMNLEELPFDKELPSDKVEFINISTTNGNAFPKGSEAARNNYGGYGDGVGVACIRPKGSDDYYVVIAFGGHLLAAMGAWESHSSAKTAFRQIIGQFNLKDSGCER